MKIRSGFSRGEDGLALYWRSVGEGPPMVCCNGVGVSVSWWRSFVEAFAPRHRILLWDYPGHGLSEVPRDPGRTDFGIARLARELQRLIEAHELERPVLAGHSMGCQVIFEHQRQFPGSVRALVPMQGSAGRALATFMNQAATSPMMHGVRLLLRHNRRLIHWLPQMAFHGPLPAKVARGLSLVDRQTISMVDFHSYLKHLGDINWQVFVEAAVAADEHDAWDTLAQLDLPVLVVAAEHDLFTPLSLSRRMVELLPRAELAVVERGSHAAPLEQPAYITARVDRFLITQAFPELDLPPLTPAPAGQSAAASPGGSPPRGS